MGIYKEVMVEDRDFRVMNVKKTAELCEQKKSSRCTYRKKRAKDRASQGAVRLGQSIEENRGSKGN